MTTIPIKTQAFTLGYGQSHSEDLGISPLQLQADPAHPGNPGYGVDGVYQLNFTAENVLPAYPGYFEVEIDFGTQELGSTDGWATRVPVQVTMVSPSPDYIVIDKSLPDGGPVQGSHNLVIHFSVPGWAISFSNISLTFTPSN